ncbi:T9SS type A sorting domain-containing protein [Kordia sp.]|uniref:T9SS type A sorting domain-containing protein n=1 Tax=Kordia sp. TaxID=1965332 RepID=UPI003D2C6F4B
MTKKITFLTLLLMTYFANANNTCETSYEDDFFALPISGNQTSDYSYEDTIFNDIQYIANGTVIDDISYDGWRFNSYQNESGVYPAGEVLTNDINSGIKLYTSDSSNFSFVSIDYLIDLRTISSVTITFYGFRDGVQYNVQSFTVPDDQIGTFTLNWPAVDEIRVASPSMYIFFDNFSIGTAGVLSVDDVTQNSKDVALFPNPTNDFIEISGIETEEDYIIYNTLGMIVKQGIVADRKKINVTDLKSAVYFLKIGNTDTKRFVKQ